MKVPPVKEALKLIDQAKDLSPIEELMFQFKCGMSTACLEVDSHKYDVIKFISDLYRAGYDVGLWRAAGNRVFTLEVGVKDV